MNKQSFFSNKLAQFKIPTTGGEEQIVVPSGIPKQLSGGLNTSGKAFIQTGYQYLFLAAIVLAIIFTIFSGIGFITSGGDSEKLAEARKRLIYSIIGLSIVILAFVIVSAVIKVVGGDPKLFLKLK